MTLEIEIPSLSGNSLESRLSFHEKCHIINGMFSSVREEWVGNGKSADVPAFLIDNLKYLERIAALWNASPDYSKQKIKTFMVRDLKALAERVQQEQDRAVILWEKEHPLEQYPPDKELALRKKILTLLGGKLNKQADVIINKLKKRYGEEYDKNVSLKKFVPKEKYIQQRLEDFPKLPFEQQTRSLPISGFAKAALILLTLTVAHAISCGTMQKIHTPRIGQGLQPTQKESPLPVIEKPKREKTAAPEIPVSAKETPCTKRTSGEKRGIENTFPDGGSDGGLISYSAIAIGGERSIKITIPDCDPIFYSAKELYRALPLEGFKLKVNPEQGICLSLKNGGFFYYHAGLELKRTKSLYIRLKSLKSYEDSNMMPLWSAKTASGEALEAPNKFSLLGSLRALCIGHYRGLARKGELPDGYSVYTNKDGKGFIYNEVKKQLIFFGEGWGPKNPPNLIHLTRDATAIYVKSLQEEKSSGVRTVIAQLQLRPKGGMPVAGTLTIYPNKTFSVNWATWPTTKK